MILEKTYRPNAPLNYFVDMIWIGKASNLNLKSSHHAPMFTELIFNYGDTFKVEGQNTETTSNKGHHQIISGLKTTPFQTTVSGTYGSVGLLLKPFCYGMLLRKFDSSLMNTISEILYEHVFNTETPNLDLAENYLLKLFEQSQLDTNLLKFEEYLSSEILEKGTLKNFNHSIPLSQKSFIQKFKKHYLLTPSEYIKLKKVNTAIHLLKNRTSEKLTEIALAAGFYDQSHFIKLFKKFYGSTPKEFTNTIQG
ncbi:MULTISPECIES: helix-turn-helix domain-containing protein [unclassified Tenacibaculum]|uniref:helix-turn-helix domain-containing protein n=1 Tax=unclassified Tenacibaculum TaxID=2635139 RepID=UPI001F2B0C0E|nr:MULTISPECIES: helix-turn-helix domain-containing protein [unclassified Tenacibaculum]MCF2876477.1 helix-turn-helix domain-containing protein [Tenacibaculum sp. Cn5-1]MCF2936616.1 helix-turn-helix domain-containing protein [Tenacibaculum sp. Cn5-34]MCG7511791.1 helix-turn-helix domain-containing protein [Tenacibaculum sp. Cn5-46]